MPPAARQVTAAPPRRSGNRTLLLASGVAAACLLAVGVLGTFGMRDWGRVPLSVPSVPWYHSWPFYLFWAPHMDARWAALALPVAGGAAAALVRTRAGLARGRRAWLVGALAGAFVLDLAVAAVAGGPSAWSAPLAYQGEYPGAVGQVGSIPSFLGRFAELVPSLPDFAAQHPPGATIFYALVARVWPGLAGAAIATVAAACLGALVVAGLARDELGEAGARWAVVCWALAPAVVLYSATSADAMWAPVLAGAALAADRGLARRSLGWTLLGGLLLWLASMLTFAAVLVLPFLAVRAAAAAWPGPTPAEASGRTPAEPRGPVPAEAHDLGDLGGVLRWAGVTTVTVLGLAAALWLATGYDVLATVRAISDFWSTAPGTEQRAWWVWAAANQVAFVAVLGLPLCVAFLARLWAALRERAWGSFEVATLASLLVGGVWGHTRGEVERMWQFLVPFAVVVAVRQLTRWRAGLPLVAALLLVHTLAVQLLFFTRW